MPNSSENVTEASLSGNVSFPFNSRKSQDIFVVSGAGPLIVNVYGARLWLTREVPKVIVGGFVVWSFAGVRVVTVVVAS